MDFQELKVLLLGKGKEDVPTVGGRSSVSFTYNADKIVSSNSGGTQTTYSWLEVETVFKFCKEIGFNCSTAAYNPMEGTAQFPDGYPKKRDTLSVVALLKHHLKANPQFSVN